jgi:O-antigen/teichoic acid export membrane protein
MSFKKEFVKDTFVYGLGRTMKKFIGIFLLPFYARALSVEEFGVLETISTMVMLAATFLSVGLDAACGYYYFKVKESERGSLTFTLFIVRLFTFLPAFLPVFYARELSVFFFDTMNYTEAMALGCALVPVTLLLDEQTKLVRYHRKPWLFTYASIAKALVNVVLGIWLVVFLSRGVAGSLSARLTSSLVVILGVFVLFSKNRYQYRFSFVWVKKMLKFGFPLMWSGLAIWIMNGADRFFLLHYSSLPEIGKYSIAYTFSQPVLLLNMAVQLSFSVLFLELFYKEKEAEKPVSRQVAKDGFAMYFAVSLVLSLALSVYGWNLIPWITTPDYQEGAMALPFLVFAHIAAQSYQIMGPGIILEKKTWHFLWITIVAAIINIALNFFLIPEWGFLGASMATFVSFMVYWIIKVVVAHKYFPVNYPFLRIGLSYILFLGLSLLVPFAKVYGWLNVSWWMQLFLFFMGVCSVFLFGFVKFGSLRSLIQNKLLRL